MEILYLDKVESTQTYLIQKLKEKELKPPVMVTSKTQTNGIGSRGNSWLSEDGSLFLSFGLYILDLPKDLPLQSTSIYFGMITTELLRSFSSSLYLKWPNDFYIQDRKVGGIITNRFQDIVVCGIGINKNVKNRDFANLDVDTQNSTIVKNLAILIEKNESWKHIFRKFQVEFQSSKIYHFNYNDEKIDLSSATLNDDGSVTIDKKRYYSLR